MILYRSNICSNSQTNPKEQYSNLGDHGDVQENKVKQLFKERMVCKWRNLVFFLNQNIIEPPMIKILK